MDNTIFPILKNFNKPTKFLAFVIIFILGSIIGSGLGSFLAMLNGGIASTSGMLIVQACSQIGMFIIPPLLYSLLLNKKPLEDVGLSHANNIIIFIAAVALIFVSLPFNNWLTEINKAMKLPDSLAAVELWIQNMETKAQELTEQMMQMPNVHNLFINLVVIALIPAIGEELTFRGIIQGYLCKVMKTKWLAVVISALIFSAFHFQFYGFLPRFTLGLFFGLMFLWSKSLWIPICMHFINNGTAVFLYYMQQHGYENIEVDTFGSTSNTFYLVMSAILTIGLLFTSWKNRKIEKHSDNR